MRLGSFELRFSLLPWLAALVMFTFLAKLGFWQLSRAEEKRQMLEAQAQAAQLNPVAIGELSEDPDTWSYRRVSVDGRLDLGRQFLLDNQVVDKEVGYNVITPLQTQQGDELVLVDRGFVPLQGRRDQYPDIAQPCENSEFQATMYRPLAAYTLDESPSGFDEDWPVIIQQLDFQAMSQRLAQPVLPAVLRLDAASPCGFKRNWKWVGADPLKHTGYAVQWFALAATVLIIFFVLSVRRR